MIKLLHGDCTDLLKKIKSNSVDLVLTSPPYDEYWDYEGTLVWSFDIFKDIASQLSVKLKKGGVIVWVVADETKKFCESLTSFKQAIYFVEECELNLLDTMIMRKTPRFAQYPTMRRYAGCFDFMFVFCKGKPKVFNPIKDVKTKNPGRLKNIPNKGSLRFSTHYVSVVEKAYRIRGNIWKYNVAQDTNDKDVFVHPARFPEALARDHIYSWSNEGGTVLDPFMGVGTTGKMAKLLGRDFIGIEKVKSYFDIAKRRIDNSNKSYDITAIIKNEPNIKNFI